MLNEGTLATTMSLGTDFVCKDLTLTRLIDCVHEHKEPLWSDTVFMLLSSSLNICGILLADLFLNYEEDRDKPNIMHA